MPVGWILFFILFIVALAITILMVSLFGIQTYRKPSSVETKLPPAPVYTEAKYNPSKDVKTWDEFPPCFDKSPHAKKVFALILSQGKVHELRTLLDLLSILMCFSVSCTPDQMKNRMVLLQGMGANMQDAEAVERTNAFVQTVDPMVKQLLVGFTDLLHKEMKQARIASKLPMDILQTIDGELYQLCATVFPLVVEKCKGVEMR